MLGRWQGKLEILYKDEGPSETKEREQKEVLRFCSRLGAAITIIPSSIHPSAVYAPIYHPSTHPSIHQSSVHLSSIHPSIHPSIICSSIIHPLTHLSIICPSIHHPSIHSCTHLSSTHPPICPSIHPFMYSSISHLSIDPSLHPSTWRVRKRESGSRRPCGVSQCHHIPCSRSMENNSNPSQEDSS